MEQSAGCVGETSGMVQSTPLRRLASPLFFCASIHHLNPDKALALLNDLLEAGSAEFATTAVAFNLLNHRPEICTVLVIRDESWYERQKDTTDSATDGLLPLNLNDEFLANESSGSQPHLEFVTTLPFDDPKWGTITKPWLMVPPAAPALVLGAQRASEILGLKQPEWLAKFHVKRPKDDPLEPAPQ